MSTRVSFLEIKSLTKENIFLGSGASIVKNLNVSALWKGGGICTCKWYLNICFVEYSIMFVASFGLSCLFVVVVVVVACSCFVVVLGFWGCCWWWWWWGWCV